MEIQETIQESIHPLFDKFEDYTKTSVELAKLKTISKTGDIVSIKGTCSGSITSEILGNTSISFKRSALNK